MQVLIHRYKLSILGIEYSHLLVKSVIQQLINFKLIDYIAGYEVYSLATRPTQKYKFIILNFFYKQAAAHRNKCHPSNFFEHDPITCQQKTATTGQSSVILLIIYYQTILYLFSAKPGGLIYYFTTNLCIVNRIVAQVRSRTHVPKRKTLIKVPEKTCAVHENKNKYGNHI